MPRVLLLLPTRSYRIPDFLEAAGKLGVEVTVASEEASAVEGLHPEGLLTLDFRDPAGAARRAAEFAGKHPIRAVVGVDEDTAVAAAVIARELGLPSNPVQAVAAARHKPTMRGLLAEAGVPSPASRVFDRRSEGPESASKQVRFPCVLKPTFLAASRGVIRADGREEFAAAWRRIEAILEEPEVAAKGGDAAGEILVEDFVEGREVALEGLLREGELKVLALFDKPDPLDGPFFEETIYVTPSRLSVEIQERVAQVASHGALALGLRDGPVHAELRVHAGGAWLIEIAARSIGGLCSRTLRFGTGMSLEEVILRHALRMEMPEPEREKRAAGVMMIPIPGAGVLEEVRGLEEARAVAGVEDITISIHRGQRVVPLPEGSRYLGFLFSRAESPERAEEALRQAHSRLRFVISDSTESQAEGVGPPRG
ncbi:MAG TPA: ATP-grasp domain-containing protein [Thermoanaerobaculia bacterium]|nr:ATP-grasp domain-containing protein [Thermoanaerobaculia bacterium]